MKLPTLPTPASDHVPETAFGNTERADLIAELRGSADLLQIGKVEDWGGLAAEILQAADMLKADAAAYAQGRYDELQAQGPSKAEWAAMDAQQAQAVEPVAWMHPSRDPHLVSHSAYTYGSASVPLYTHPAPPAASGDEGFKPDWATYRQGVEDGKAETQQVAVPVPLTDDEIMQLGRLAADQEIDISKPTWEQFSLHLTRAIEAHHKITAKPSHTDWSAA